MAALVEPGALLHWVPVLLFAASACFFAAGRLRTALALILLDFGMLLGLYAEQVAEIVRLAGR